MKRLALLLVLLGAVGVLAGGKNLQHFPKDTSDDALKAEMKKIARSLGAECAHCHRMKPERDFSVDTENKKTARSMLDMTKKMTEKHMTKDFLGFKKDLVATCWMCHRGKEKPEYEPEDKTANEKFEAAVQAGKKKNKVEAMKKLVAAIDESYFTWKDAPKATCWMCHRGRFEFKVEPPKEEEEKKEDKEPD